MIQQSKNKHNKKILIIEYKIETETRINFRAKISLVDCATKRLKQSWTGLGADSRVGPRNDVS